MTKKGKSMMTIAVVATVAFLGTGGTIAAGRIAENNAIGKEAAQNFAYIDAGILPDVVTWARTQFDFENGVFVYNVEFIADGVKYDYDIKAVDGTVIAKESERVAGYVQSASVPTDKTAGETATSAASTASTATGLDIAAVQPAPETGSPSYVSVDDAKLAASTHAGVAHQSSIMWTKAKLESDDGRSYYDVEFYVGDMEYDYEIDALSGKVVESGQEQREGTETKPQTASAPAKTPGTATTTASSQTPAATTPSATASQPNTPAATTPSTTASQPTTPAATQPSTPAQPSTPVVTQPAAPAQPAEPAAPAVTQPAAPAAPAQPAYVDYDDDDDDDDDWDDHDDWDDYDDGPDDDEPDDYDDHDDHDDDDDDD